MPIWEETELLHQEERTLYCHQDALEIHPAEPGKEFRMENTKQVSLAVNESICNMKSSLIYKLKDCWGLQPWKWCTFFHENLARLKIGRHYTVCQTAWKKLEASEILVEISLRKLLTFCDAFSGLFPRDEGAYQLSPIWTQVISTPKPGGEGASTEWLCTFIAIINTFRNLFKDSDTFNVFQVLIKLADSHRNCQHQ